MLTDIFARRYAKRPLFERVEQPTLRLLMQGFRIIEEQLFKFYMGDGKINPTSKATWTGLHDRLSMELGLKELSARHYSYKTEWMGKTHTQTGTYEMNMVCENYLTRPFNPEWDPDVFIKNRLSFIELAFREREEQINRINDQLPTALLQARIRDAADQPGRMVVPSTRTHVEATLGANSALNASFDASVHELNTRFQQAGVPLHYHNGFIQISADALTQAQIEQPFWALVKDTKWANVDTDMKEAIDLRDSGGRDPALYAAKALESAIKIICDERGWTTGKEKGASDFLNHLEAKANGPFVSPWERELMQKFFSGVRNALGHGPGGEPMPALTQPQTDQAIELCMSWIKTLIARL